MRTAGTVLALVCGLAAGMTAADAQAGKQAVVCTAYIDVNRRAPIVYATAAELQAQPPEARLRQLLTEKGIRPSELMCFTGATLPDAENAMYRNRRPVAVLQVPEGWYNGAAAAPNLAPKPTPSATVASGGSGGSLIIEDRKPVAKTVAAPKPVARPPLPAPKSVDRGSNKSKCRKVGNRFVCPTSKQ